MKEFLSDTEKLKILKAWMVTKYQKHFMANGKIMTKKKQPTVSQIMEARAKQYGPVKSQMETIGTIQAELFQYCMARNNNQLSREILAHLAALNQVVTKMVRSVSNREHQDNYLDLRNYARIAEECTDFNQNKEASR